MPKLVRRRWEADLSAFGGRRARQGFSYEAYVPDPIAALDLALPADVALVANEAERAVRELNQHPPRLGAVETLARQLLRAESVASSRIEGLVLSHRRLARASFADPDARADLTAASVLANIRAMDEAVRLATVAPRCTVAHVQAIHQRLFEAFGDPQAGRLRVEQNWIGGAASSPRDAEFIPPPPDEVPGLLTDLCAFMARDDLPAVVQAAVAHAQFETIHPFADGNGRVGRCLIHVVLRRRGVALAWVPPVSLVLATDSKAYVRGLTDFRAGRVTDWCGLFAQATRTAAREAEGFAREVEALQGHWLAQAGQPRADSSARALIGVLPATPLLDVASAAAAIDRSNQAARLAVLALERAGVLKRLNVGRRNRAWEATGLFALLDEFERRLAALQGRAPPSTPSTAKSTVR